MTAVVCTCAPVQYERTFAHGVSDGGAVPGDGLGGQAFRGWAFRAAGRWHWEAIAIADEPVTGGPEPGPDPDDALIPDVDAARGGARDGGARDGGADAPPGHADAGEPGDTGDTVPDSLGREAWIRVAQGRRQPRRRELPVA